MVRHHHPPNGHEFEQTPGDTKGQGSLPCFCPWGHSVTHDLATQQHKEQKHQCIGK